MPSLKTVKVDTTNIPGTGYTLSAAIAANLVLCQTPLSDFNLAKDDITGAWKQPRSIGQCSGWPLGV